MYTCTYNHTFIHTYIDTYIYTYIHAKALMQRYLFVLYILFVEA